MSVAVVGTLFLLFISTAARSADPDIETIRQRVLQRMQDRSVNEEKVRQLMNDMTADVVGERTFELPGGRQGGRSVTYTIRIK